MAEVVNDIYKTYQAFSADGYRTLGVAYKVVDFNTPIKKDDEKDMIFATFITLFDPPKEGIAETIVALNSLEIKLK